MINAIINSYLKSIPYFNICFVSDALLSYSAYYPTPTSAPPTSAPQLVPPLLVPPN